LFGLSERGQLFLTRKAVRDARSVAPGISAHSARARVAISISEDHLAHPDVALAWERGLGLLPGELLDTVEVMVAAQSAFRFHRLGRRRAGNPQG